jgi:ribonuclease D
MPEPFQIQIVDTHKALTEAVAQLRRTDRCALDSEFTSQRKTLALIQVAIPGTVYLIDPLAIQDLSPLFEVLEDESVIKIIHSTDDDARVFYRQHHIVLQGVLDTQILAGFCGFRYRMALQGLVAELLNEDFSKGMRVTDWTQRPLTLEQMQYAANDAAILPSVWAALSERVDDPRKLDWTEDESRESIRKVTTTAVPAIHIWKSLSPFRNDPHRTVFAYRLHIWRQSEAVKLGKSPEGVLKGHTVNDMVKHMDSGEKGFAENAKIPKRIRKEHLEEIVEMAEAPATTTELDWLSGLPSERLQDHYREVLSHLLLAVLSSRSNLNGVSERLVGGREAINDLLRFGKASASPLTRGWRAELLGNAFSDWVGYRGGITVDFNDHQLVASRSG